MNDYCYPEIQTVVWNPVEAAVCPESGIDFRVPAPFGKAAELLEKLPKYAKVLCAITAVEMVLPVWEEGVVAHESLSEYLTWPRKTVNALYDYWFCNGPRGNCPSVIIADHVSTQALISGQTSWVAGACEALVWLLQKPSPLSEPEWSIAVSYAATAMSTRCSIGTFYDLWWRRCMARLAFRLDKSPELENNDEEEASNSQARLSGLLGTAS